jgi:cytochrome c peroxidase
LRELAQTAPYMHNGMLKTLEDVVDFYNKGGGEDSHKDAAMKPLNLKDQEKKDLVAFLKALSGDKLTGADYVWSEKYPDEYPVIADWNNKPN